MPCKIVRYKKFCKHCEYRCLKSDGHFYCNMCYKIDYDICYFRMPYCKSCNNVIKNFEEFIDKYGQEVLTTS